MRYLPPLAAIRAFEAAARHESFTRAAEELGMTQSGMSYQVGLLEQRLGIQLFVRSGRRVALSGEGYKLAVRLTRSLDDIAAAVAELVGEDCSTLTVSTTHTVATNWLAPRLGSFRKLQPDLSVRIETGSELADFVGDDVDVALRFGEGTWPGTVSHFLFRWYGTPVCTPEFRDRNGILEPSDLLRVDRLSPDYELWATWIAEAGVKPPEGGSAGDVLFDSQVADGQAVLAGEGVAMLTPLLWEKELASGRMVRLFPAIAFEDAALWLVYSQGHRNKPKIQGFRRWLLAEVDACRAAGPKGDSGVFASPLRRNHESKDGQRVGG